MELYDLEFEDEDARLYLEAKKCMEDADDKDYYDDEFITLLCERYLDQKKGEGVVYETDPDEE